MVLLVNVLKSVSSNSTQQQ